MAIQNIILNRDRHLSSPPPHRPPISVPQEQEWNAFRSISFKNNNTPHLHPSSNELRIQPCASYCCYLGSALDPFNLHSFDMKTASVTFLGTFQHQLESTVCFGHCPSVHHDVFKTMRKTAGKEQKEDALEGQFWTFYGLQW